MEKDLIDDMTQYVPNDLGDDKCRDGYINRWLIDPHRPDDMKTIMIVLLLKINVVIPCKGHDEPEPGNVFFFPCLDVKVLEPNPIDG